MGRHKRPFVLPARISNQVKPIVEAFVRAFEEASPDEQAELRVCLIPPNCLIRLTPPILTSLLLRFPLVLPGALSA
jgi:hypothetical protein